MKRIDPADQPLLPALAALGWHIGDGVLSMMKAHKKTHRIWAGVGVGWSAFMVSMILLAKAKREWYNSNSDK